MTGLFSRLFKKDKTIKDINVEAFLNQTIEGVLKKANLQVLPVITREGPRITVIFNGADNVLFIEKDGMLLDAFQILTMRILQNRFSDERFEVEVDCDGFREQSAQELRGLAEKLKNYVLEKGGTSYVRALPPRERKIVHRYLAEDARVQSRSIGDGFCKKIKITLVENENQAGTRFEQQEETFRA